jgi:TetR/AcrR family transcriptional regulator, tetracycline repressor protein
MHPMTQPTSNRQAAPPPVKRSRGGTQPAPLSRDDIVRAALPLLERDGVDGLTVRAVADELSISSPAVYHYFANRDALIDRLCEQIATEVDVDVAPGTAWDDAIVQVLLNMDRTFARYPGVAERVLPSRKPSAAADRITGTVHRLIVDGGFADDDAEEVLASLQYVFGGWLLGKPGRRGAQRASADTLERSIRWLLAGAAHDTRSRA